MIPQVYILQLAGPLPILHVKINGNIECAQKKMAPFTPTTYVTLLVLIII